MEKVGVMAVVEGLGSFVNDIGKINSAMDSLKPQGNMLTNLFSGVGNAIASFGREVLNVAEVALGALLRDAIQFIIGKLKDLINATIEAGSEFQTLQLRLNRLNFNDAIAQTGDYSRATEMATKATKEQLTWIQKLAVTTPYDAQDIAQVFTLARSYGFASDAAKGLTEDISNFAAGMGLGSTEIERIIVNFGQMVQQGKVTQREMSDLARGAFVPVNDILKRMQENVGLTGKAFDNFRNSGKGVNAFMTAFSQIVNERFRGASEAMARTFQGATANLQDFLKSIIGFNIVRPILDEIGGRIADFITQTTQGNVFNRLNASAAQLGDTLRGVISAVLDLFNIGKQPITLFDDLAGGLKQDEFAGGIGDRIVAGLTKVRVWIDGNKDKIVGFFAGIRDAVVNHVIPFIGKMVDKLFELRDWFTANRPAIEAFFKNIGEFIQNKVVPFVLKLVEAFGKIADWVDNNGLVIQHFFTALGEIAGKVFENLTGVDLGGGMEGFLSLIESFMKYVIDNQETIANFITNLIKLSAVFTVIGFVLGVLMSVFTAIVTPIIAVISVIAGLVAIIAALFTPIGLLIVLIAVLVAQLIANWQYVVIAFQYLGAVISAWASDTWNAISTWATNVWTVMSNWVAQTWATFIEWSANLGTVVNQWITDTGTAIGNWTKAMVAKFTQFVQDVIKAFRSVDWMDVGRKIINGIADGVDAAAHKLIDAAVNAAKNAIDAVSNALGIHSPSKVFFAMGINTMKGFANGILESAKFAERAMEGAVASITAPAFNLPSITQQYAVATAPSVNNQNSYTNNYNLNINSNSTVEPIIQDYNMLKSLAGA